MKRTNIPDNPFVLQPYVSEELFCDRKKEMESIISHIENGANVTLISMRRIGKTGLILRTFEELRKKKYGFDTYYADIYATSGLDDFVKVLAEAVVSQSSQSAIKRFFTMLGGIRPLVSYDPISGQPQVSITYQTELQKETTLKSLMSYLDSTGKKVVVAIDEFQQIREYEDCRMEALLRSHIQNLKNVRFIFSGSRRHIMTDIFAGSNSPFYQSTVNIPLRKLNSDIYAEFIKDKFDKGGKSIDDNTIRFILEWTRCHTFYTQTLCNNVYMRAGETVSMQNVYSAIESIFEAEEDRFFTIRNMLTKGQWRYLKAIAKEQIVTQPTSGSFISKYGLGTPASSRRTMASLIEKELVLEADTPEGKEYSVYNLFLSRWLES